MSDTERAVPGTDLVLGRGPGGDPVLLERTPALPPASAAGLRPVVDRFRALVSPHLVRPRDVLVDDGRTLVVLDPGPVRSLAALAAARGALEPGEVVTVGVALARALTAAHADDLLLGALSSAQVLLRDDGMPLVVAGAHALLASAAGSDPGGARARDVGAVAALCLSLLGPDQAREIPADLVAALRRAADPDLAQRPDAVVLGALLARACAPAPVRLTVERAPAPGPARGAEQPRLPARGLPARGLLALAALVVVAAVAGWVSAPEDDLPPPPRALRWSVVLDRLDAARASAFAAADESALGRVYAPAARPLAEDRARVRALAASGRTAHRVRHRVHDVEVLPSRDDRVRLRVTDVLVPYEVRDGDGAVVGTAPGRDEAVSVVELTRTAAGWRIVEVVRPA